jgi:hypothetical protein
MLFHGGTLSMMSDFNTLQHMSFCRFRHFNLLRQCGFKPFIQPLMAETMIMAVTRVSVL